MILWSRKLTPKHSMSAEMFNTLWYYCLLRIKSCMSSFRVYCFIVYSLVGSTIYQLVFSYSDPPLTAIYLFIY